VVQQVMLWPLYSAAGCGSRTLTPALIRHRAADRHAEAHSVRVAIGQKIGRKPIIMTGFALASPDDYPLHRTLGLGGRTPANTKNRGRPDRSR